MRDSEKLKSLLIMKGACQLKAGLYSCCFLRILFHTDGVHRESGQSLVCLEESETKRIQRT